MPNFTRSQLQRKLKVSIEEQHLNYKKQNEILKKNMIGVIITGMMAGALAGAGKSFRYVTS